MTNNDQPRTAAGNPDGGKFTARNRDEASVELNEAATSGPVLKICKSCGREIEHLGDFPGPLCLQCYRDSDDAKIAWEAEDIQAMWSNRGRRPNRGSRSN